MLFENVETAIRLIIAYFVTFILYGSWILKPFFKEKSIMYRLIAYEVVGNMYIVFCGYFLSYLKIYGTLSVYAVVFIIPAAVKIIVQRKYYKSKIDHFKDWYHDRVTFKPSLKVTARNVKNGIEKKLALFYTNYLKQNLLDILVFVCISVLSFVLFTYFRAYLSAYTVADEEVHLYWISSILENQAFPSGLYPHAMHFLISFLSSIGFTQITRSVMCFVVLQDFLIFGHLYALMRTLFRYKGAAIFGILFFMLTDVFNVCTFERYRSTLPMEFGYATVFISFIYLFYYIREKDKKSLFLFILSVAWSFQAHFYDTIWLIFLCIGFGLVYITVLIRQKQLFKVILAGILGIVIAFAPLGVGFACGYSFEQSISWGLGIISSSIESDTSDTEDTELESSETQTETSESEMQTDVSDSKQSDSTDESVSEEVSYDTDGEEEEENLSTLEKIKLKIGDRNIVQYVADCMGGSCCYYGCSTFISDSFLLSGIETVFENVFGVSIQSYGNLVLCLLAAGLDLVIIFVLLIQLIFRKKRDFSKFRLYLFLLVGWLICVFMYLCYSLGLPVIIAAARCTSMFALFSSLIFPIPLDFLGEELALIKPFKRFSEIATCCVAFLLIGVVCLRGGIKDGQSGRYSFIGESDMRLCLDLVENEEEKQWTVVSSTRDLSVIRFAGYHYEIVDLLEDMEKGKDVYIPTQDFYVILSKDATNENLINVSMQEIDDLFTKSRVYLYTDYADIIYSKLYFWMEKMKTVYPSEIEVYSDRDDYIIYKVHQDPYFLLNLNVDYQNVDSESMNSEIIE